ncbi:MAG TPA: hypothetical protein VH796_10475, partial [Nitrososphaeraceae archaeon]
ILADLLRTDMIPECYIPNEDIRNLRDLARRRHYFVNTRTMFKNKVHDITTKNQTCNDLMDLYSTTSMLLVS